MRTILDNIVEVRRKKLTEEMAATSIQMLECAARRSPPPMNFASVLSNSGIHIVAEVKKASPSKGILRSDFDPVSLGLAYQDGGAAAISVLTEQDHFMGSLSAFRQVRESVSVPLLRKDFIVDIYQVLESRAAGADSFLLIAALMDKTHLTYLIDRGRELGMEPLIEVHSQNELRTALESGAKILGINNRDLRTFSVDLNVTLQLVRYVPRDRIVVSESGIKTRDEVLRLQDAGVAAFLIGESIVTSADPASRIRELVNGGS